MNEIVLLMTNVLATKQASTSIVSKQPAIQLDNGVKNSTQGESYQLTSNAKSRHLNSRSLMKVTQLLKRITSRKITNLS